jgi:hypothetical protein
MVDSSPPPPPEPPPSPRLFFCFSFVIAQGETREVEEDEERNDLEGEVWKEDKEEEKEVKGDEE